MKLVLLARSEEIRCTKQKQKIAKSLTLCIKFIIPSSNIYFSRKIDENNNYMRRLELILEFNSLHIPSTKHDKNHFTNSTMEAQHKTIMKYISQ